MDGLADMLRSQGFDPGSLPEDDYDEFGNDSFRGDKTDAATSPPAASSFLRGLKKDGLAQRMFQEKKLPRESYVEIHDLVAKAELNGLVGQIRGFVKDKERYAVDVDPNSAANVAVLEEHKATAGATSTATGSSSSSNASSATTAESTSAAAPPLSFSSTSRFLLQRKNLVPIEMDLERWTRKKLRKRDHVDESKNKNAATSGPGAPPGVHQEDDDESETSESEADSDGSLCASKIPTHERRKERRRARNVKKYPFMANMQVHGVPKDHEENPAYKYPKTGSRPVLVIAGVGHVDKDDGSNFTLNSILHKESAKWKQWGCRFLSFKQGNSHAASEKIQEAIQSGQYGSILIGDLSASGDYASLQRFVDHLGPALGSFVRELGGSVAFTTSTGDVIMSEVFPKLWPEIGWKMSAYYRATHCAVQRNRNNVARIFPGAEDWKFSVKGNMLEDVPENEMYFATSQEMKMFRYLSDDYDAERDPDEHRRNAIVAVKQFPLVSEKNRTGCGGKVAYFGDINGQAETAHLVVKFLETHAIATEEMGYRI
ncbi:unnamed protein product [Amoebophrya sp. A120]|nr:unnamed protein product [Amoebophrya sp. A120]|eukprot:GSA120T00005377001.1